MSVLAPANLEEVSNTAPAAEPLTDSQMGVYFLLWCVMMLMLRRAILRVGLIFGCEFVRIRIAVVSTVVVRVVFPVC